METNTVAVPGARLEVFDHGVGDPVLLVQTALTADELWPMAADSALAEFRRILPHRRGYAGSSGVEGPGSIVRDAADCAALLDALDVDRAHVVGVSYSAAVALQLAIDHPDRAHTLVLVEPPPVHTASAPAFRAATRQLIRSRHDRGEAEALDEFLNLVVGPDWRRQVETWLPGAAAQMRRDTATFFDTDLPALLAWGGEPVAVERIRCPVQHVGGTASGPWFAEVRALVHQWFPDVDDVVVAGADHSLALTHAPQIARAIAGFLRRHPMP